MRLRAKAAWCIAAIGTMIAISVSGSAQPTAPLPAVSASQPQPASGAYPLERADLESWMDGFFPNALAQADIAGAVVVVVKDGQVLAQKGYGYADVGNRIPADPSRTRVRVGSISKSLVWTAVMQQVERGKLDLDRDINAYLDFRIPEKFGKPITLRNLMTHSSGFSQTGFRSVPDGQMPRDLKGFLTGTPVPRRIDPPGTVSAYSNYASMLAGYIVERVSGERFVDYMDRHILQPLGMTQSSYRRPLPAPLRAALWKDYRLGSGPPETNTEDNEEPAGDPSGHLTTTAADMSRFMIAHLGQGGALLRPETARQMHQLAFKPSPIVKGMALGLFRMDRNGHRIIGHPGDIVSSHTDMELLPEQGVGFFLAVNSDGAPVGALDAGNVIRWSFAKNFMNRYFPDTRPSPPTISTMREHGKLAEGEYSISQRFEGDFNEAAWLIGQYFSLGLGIKANADGTIETPGFLSFEDGRPQTWREVAPFVWREVGGGDDGILNMRVEKGRVVAFATSDIIAVFEMQRVPFLRSAALNVPLLMGAVLILVLALLLWPTTYLVRRHYGQPAVLSATEEKSDRWTKVAIVVALAYLAGWMVAMGSTSSVDFATPIRIVQVIGLLVVAGAAVALWNVWATFKGGRAWTSKLWSLLVALALAEIVYFSFAFKLLSTSLNY